MSGQAINLRPMSVVIAVFLLCLPVTNYALGQALASQQGGRAGREALDEVPESPGKSPRRATVPRIKRLDTYQFLKGERPLRSPLALARDGHNGDLVVSSFESGEVVILDQAGALIQRIGREAGLHTPYGVAVDTEGRIYVGEVESGRVKVFGASGRILDEFDLSELRGKRVSPGRLTLDAQGRLYVVDLSNNEILLLSPQGSLLSVLGEFDYLQKAAAGPQGKIIGLSALGSAVTVMDEKGAKLRWFGKHGDSSDRNVSFPTGFAVDGKARVWIADAFQHRLKVFSLAGEFLFNYGKMEEEGGGFFFPVDLCFGDQGRLYVLEKGAERLQVFQVEDLYETSDE